MKRYFFFLLFISYPILQVHPVAINSGFGPQKNRPPKIDSVKVDSKPTTRKMFLNPEEYYRAQVWVTDPDGDKLIYKWMVVEDGGDSSNEKREKLRAVHSSIPEGNLSEIYFKAPTKKGSYRLLISAEDTKGQVADTSVSLYVQ